LNLRNVLVSTLFIVCVVVPLTPGNAQSFDKASVADTSSPRATLRSFIDATNSISDLVKGKGFIRRSSPSVQQLGESVIDCLDTSNLPTFAAELRATEVAVCIKEILDRQQLPPWEQIPDIEAIEAAGGFEQLSTWRVPGTRLTIARVEQGERKHEYLFSAGTVDRAVGYYRSMASRPYRQSGPKTSPGLYQWYMSAPGHPLIADWVSRLPDRMRFGQSFGLINWKWPGLLISLLIAGALLVLCYSIYIAFFNRARTRGVFASWLLMVFPLAAISIPYLFVSFAENYLIVRGSPSYVIGFLSTVVTTMAAVFIVFAFGNRIAESVIASPRVNPQGLNAQLIRIASKLSSTVLAVTVVLVGGQFLGIPVATLLASAGIGGIALALGAQDTLKTLFGTIMLMADKPFRVGERIIFKDYDGVVEDIGLRSTRIRLLNSHQVSVPNDQLAGSDIENVGRRDCIRRVVDIHIPNDTPCEKLEKAVSLVREQLDQHEGMNEKFPPRVFFVDFLPNAFTIRVIYWYHPADYWDYVAFSEQFNFAIFHAFEKHNIQFSLPQRITHTSLESDAAPVDVRMIEPA
jgi:MscS family membrane protein